MGTRKPDRIQLTAGGSSLDRFSRLTVVNDILGQAEAVFETGDEASWNDLEQLLAHGTEAVVLLNDKPRLRGRTEVLEASAEPDSGVNALVTVRTKMSDARYASAKPRTIKNDVTIRQFVESCYEQIGVTPGDFEFDALADVGVMTGVDKGGSKIDFEAAKPDQAKVKPPETIFAACDRHLRRFRALHWDGANGKIVVGKPDDSQEPRYVLRSRKGSGASDANNICGVRYVQDWTEVAQEVWLVGATPGRESAKLPVKGTAIDDSVLEVASRTGHFQRLVLIPQQQAEDKQAADRQALHELTKRRQRKNGWEVLVDGWSYWNGHEQVPYAPNTTVDLTIDVLGGARGRHLITRVALDYSIDGGTTTRLTCVAAGIFDI